MLNIILIITLIVDLILPFFISPFYNYFKPLKMPLSVLGCNNSPVRWIYNIWCIISGIIISLLSYQIYEFFNNSIGLAIYIIIIIYALFCETISGFFPLNEKKEDISISSKIHEFTSTIGFTIFPVSSLLIGINLINNNTLFGIISIICFIISIILFVFFIIGEKEKFNKTILNNEGLWQRLIMLISYIPLILILMFLI